jgi:GT2 family glycosyltransferase/peptidoglycan/xylan/chitin deacetylase (PgdA/CDA1 family)
MILTFHKVAAISKSFWWIENDDFYRILNELEGSQFVYLDDYDPKNDQHVVITFDGPYSVILEYAAPELHRRGIPFEVYVIGDYINGNNAFDSVEPLTDFCTLEEIRTLIDLGGRLQWHTRTHQLEESPSTETIFKEFTVPKELLENFPNHFKHFAYPHGSANVEMRRIAETLFNSAASVDDGDPNDRFYLPRVTVGPGHSFKKFDLTLIIVNHNYGHFISECIESVRNQSVMPTEVHVVDDFSSDGSREFLPSLVNTEKLYLNETNLGIVDNFNKAMSRVTTEFAMFLGADNYLHPRTIELIGRALSKNRNSDIVYFDMLIVGPLASELASKVKARKVGYSVRDNLDLFYWEFPDFNTESARQLKSNNFINGSAAFRTQKFNEVGGYRKTYPEDHNLWVRMIEGGSTAIRVPKPLLYYRQHSVSQANTMLSALLEVKHLRKLNAKLVQEIHDFRMKSENQDLTQAHQELNKAHQELNKAHQELNRNLISITNSTIWKFSKPFRLSIDRLKRLLKD